ncbi:g12075 [Coccomyxa viridis]|uniref:G12075 protein n=1 Tax=Coccomyxa viridis TaxID=1274662 RepID=A0ABP1GE47_9CHLO
MGANRKLQQEIDRTLKKVQEGIEVFDQIWEKVYDADSGAQKEKYEADLKKEIKKLQRYREDIKKWISGTDIKDKSDLMKARKDVERQMERFKVCEKEMKTKAFSKEGLGQATKLDPREKARNEMRDWINETVDKLTAETETFDAEMEGLASNVKKNKKLPARHGHLEESISRHKQHVTRLEQMLRLLDNEALAVDDMSNAKEMVDDYMERNQEDFEDFVSPDDVYEEILHHLDSLEAQLPLAPAAVHGKGKDAKEKEKERQVERERAAAQAAKAQLAAQGGLNVKLEEPEPSPERPPPPPPVKKVADAPAAAKAAPVKEPPTPTGRSASATLSKAEPRAPTPTTPSRATAVFPPRPSSPIPVPGPPDNIPPPTTRTSRHSSMDSHLRDEAAGAAAAAPPPPVPPPPPAAWGFAGDAGAARAEAFPSLGQMSDGQNPKRAPSLRGPSAAMSASLPDTQKGSQPGSVPKMGFANAVSGRMADMSQQATTPQSMAGAPIAADGSKGLGPLLAGWDGDLADAAPESQAQRAAPVTAGVDVLKILSACGQRSTPTQQDGQWQHVPPRMRQFPGGVPASYPPGKHPTLDDPATYAKLDTEALFFAFYYQPGSYQQFLAAKELKRQSWRYHKGQRSWFQRHEEPKTANDEYEQGTYVYFDYSIIHDDQQMGWCYRLKQDFVFKYELLEDELRVE